MKLIKIYSSAGQLEAEMIKAFLESQGLKVILSQESLGRTMGLSAGRLGQVQVLVPESQVAEAMELLDAMADGEYENFDHGDFSDDLFPPDEEA